jgi:lipid II:glycine glycyltransferase (peptidoglycan interpeptide bridge formation enzyme)
MARTLIIDLSQDINTIWKNIKRKRRGDITRAIKRGISVEVNIHYDEWYILHTFSATKLGSQLGDLTTIKSEGLLFVGLYEGKVLAGEWFKFFNNDTWMRTRFAASKRFDSNKSLSALAHALVIWESIKYAKEHGYKTYDFGGYQPEIEVTKNIRNGKKVSGEK